MRYESLLRQQGGLRALLVLAAPIRRGGWDTSAAAETVRMVGMLQPTMESRALRGALDDLAEWARGGGHDDMRSRFHRAWSQLEDFAGLSTVEIWRLAASE